MPWDSFHVVPSIRQATDPEIMCHCQCQGRARPIQTIVLYIRCTSRPRSRSVRFLSPHPRLP